MPRTGRPPKIEGKKDQLFQTRFTKETMNKLKECAAYFETTRTAILERGIELIHESLGKE